MIEHTCKHLHIEITTRPRKDFSLQINGIYIIIQGLNSENILQDVVIQKESSVLWLNEEVQSRQQLRRNEHLLKLNRHS